MNPGVMAPSHMPNRKRTANRAPNERHAACRHNTNAQTKMLMLERVELRTVDTTVAHLIHFPTGNR